jgi:hypothetical protein
MKPKMKLIHTLVVCKECPFRKGQSYLMPGRAAEIADYMGEQGGGKIFPCHKHADAPRVRDRLVCAGSILYALRRGIWTQAMQIGERLGLYDTSKIRPADVYQSRDEMIRGHSRWRKK